MTQTNPRFDRARLDRPEFRKSIFPVFAVNVPMPAGTAVPPIVVLSHGRQSRADGSLATGTSQEEPADQ
jgi:hypothetical protein